MTQQKRRPFSSLFLLENSFILTQMLITCLLLVPLFMSLARYFLLVEDHHIISFMWILRHPIHIIHQRNYDTRFWIHGSLIFLSLHAYLPPFKPMIFQIGSLEIGIHLQILTSTIFVWKETNRFLDSLCRNLRRNFTQLCVKSEVEVGSFRHSAALLHFIDVVKPPPSNLIWICSLCTADLMLLL